MRSLDSLRFATLAITSQRLRSFLTVLGIAVGIGAVILLTSIGEGVQQYMVREFTQFGAHLVAIVPGKTATLGMSAAVIGNVRPLTLEDEEALAKVLKVRATAPFVQGNAAVKAGTRQRRVNILGVGPQAEQVWQIKLAFGRFLPPDDQGTARPFAVLGSKARSELFPNQNPLGEIIRIGGSRFRVVGVMETKGQILGFDLDDAVYIPAAQALELFNREGLMEIDALYAPGTPVEKIAARLKERLLLRHGREDFTINTQDQMLQTLGSILDKLTLSVAALGAISLVVGAVGILTTMTIAVHDRTAEIGLLRALGATRKQVVLLFLQEAVMLSSAGGLLGLLLGWGGARLTSLFLPALPTHTGPFYVVLSLLLAFVIGLAAGVLPALRAAGLDPVDSLRAE